VNISKYGTKWKMVAIEKWTGSKRNGKTSLLNYLCIKSPQKIYIIKDRIVDKRNDRYCSTASTNLNLFDETNHF